MFRIILLFNFTLIYLYSYELGRGVSLLDTPLYSMKIGGHLSIIYRNDSSIGQVENNKVMIDDLEVMLYGDLENRFSYLIEVGVDEHFNLENNSNSYDSQQIKFKRLYGTYMFNDNLNVTFGRFLTPIGIWNPVYINALRATTIEPFVADNFHPNSITGISFFGRFGIDKKFEYTLFRQLKTEKNQSVVNVASSNFIGTELKYHLDINSRVALVAGKYKNELKQEDIVLAGFNAKIALEEDEISSELLYKDIDKAGKSENLVSSYIQYLRYLKDQHYLVLRLGQRNGGHHQCKCYEALIGYNYRPYPTLSMKTEIRHYDKSRKDKKTIDENQLFFSLSVLF